MTGLTIAQVAEVLRTATAEELPTILATLATDSRAGVRAACASAEARLRRGRVESARLERLYAIESDLRAQGCLLAAGVDEVGRGALAGPLTAAAVILPAAPHIKGLDDSKRLTPARRDEVAQRVRDVAVSVAIAHVPAYEIDTLGMTRALHKAMTAALEALSERPEHVLVDGRPVGVGPRETAIVKGDAKVAAIAAASVVAKVERDALMCSLGTEYPGYGFDVNKGYGSADHLAAIDRLGLTEHHRRSFAPCGGTLSLF